MSDPSEPQGLVRGMVDASARVLASLPPAFLVLVALNIAFLALVMWFLNSQMLQRTALVTRIVEHCLAH